MARFQENIFADTVSHRASVSMTHKQALQEAAESIDAFVRCVCVKYMHACVRSVVYVYTHVQIRTHGRESPLGTVWGLTIIEYRLSPVYITGLLHRYRITLKKRRYGTRVKNLITLYEYSGIAIFRWNRKEHFF